MKNIREYLSSAAGLIKAQGRVLSMIITLLLLSSGVWAYDNARIMGSWDDYTEHDISKVGDTYSVSLTGNTTYEFGVKRNEDWFSCDNCSITTNTEKTLSKQSYKNVRFTPEFTGVYIFTFVKDENTSITIKVTPESCATAATVNTVKATDITSTSATLGGTIINEGKTVDCTDAEVTQVFIEWTRTVTPVSAEGAIQANRSGSSYSVSTIGQATLVPGNTYYYRAKVINNAGKIGYGEEMSFTTETLATVVRIGAKPSVTESCGLDVNAYVAQTGCADITNITLYYSNNSAFRSDGSYLTSAKNFSITDATINSSKLISLTPAEIGAVVEPGNKVYLRLTATNSNGTSGYSDVLPVAYNCTKFVTSDIVANFTACPNNHQFNWSDMFLSPTPTTWRATLGGSDATSHFTLTDGVMVWNTEGKTVSEYVYTFTASADGYGNATATLTINYTVPGSISGEITSVTPDPVTSKENPTTPYTEVGLTAEGTIGDISQIEWTIKPSGGSISNESGNTLPATATFKAEAKTYNTTYTVTATVYNSSCASSSASTTIVVAPDETEVCD